MELVKDAAEVTGSTPDRMKKVNLFETARFFCDVYVLAKGQAQAPHAHAASDKVLVVLSGKGTVRVDGRAYDVRPGHATLCPAGSEHGVENTGTEELRLLAFMAPHPKPPAVSA